MSTLADSPSARRRSSPYQECSMDLEEAFRTKKHSGKKCKKVASSMSMHSSLTGNGCDGHELSSVSKRSYCSRSNSLARRQKESYGARHVSREERTGPGKERQVISSCPQSRHRRPPGKNNSLDLHRERRRRDHHKSSHHDNGRSSSHSIAEKKDRQHHFNNIKSGVGTREQWSSGSTSANVHHRPRNLPMRTQSCGNLSSPLKQSNLRKELLSPSVGGIESNNAPLSYPRTLRRKESHSISPRREQYVPRDRKHPKCQSSPRRGYKAQSRSRSPSRQRHRHQQGQCRTFSAEDTIVASPPRRRPIAKNNDLHGNQLLGGPSISKLLASKEHSPRSLNDAENSFIEEASRASRQSKASGLKSITTSTSEDSNQTSTTNEEASAPDDGTVIQFDPTQTNNIYRVRQVTNINSDYSYSMNLETLKGSITHLERHFSDGLKLRDLHEAVKDCEKQQQPLKICRLDDDSDKHLNLQPSQQQQTGFTHDHTKRYQEASLPDCFSGYEYSREDEKEATRHFRSEQKEPNGFEDSFATSSCRRGDMRKSGRRRSNSRRKQKPLSKGERNDTVNHIDSNQFKKLPRYQRRPKHKGRGRKIKKEKQRETPSSPSPPPSSSEMKLLFPAHMNEKYQEHRLRKTAAGLEIGASSGSETDDRSIVSASQKKKPVTTQLAGSIGKYFRRRNSPTTDTESDRDDCTVSSSLSSMSRLFRASRKEHHLLGDDDSFGSADISF